MTELISRRLVLGFALTGAIALSAPALGENPMDFSDVTSRERAEQLAADGRLVRILLFPAEFGGEDVPPNVIFVPPAIAPIREALIGALRRFVREGLIDQLTVNPDYQGNSFVPVRLRFNATHSTRGGAFQPTIQIWPIAGLVGQ